MNVTVLIMIGGIIILGLVCYAAYLFLQLKTQKQQQEQQRYLAIQKRNANIFDNVKTLCDVGIQGQCDLSEISIRLYCIMEYVQGSAKVDFDKIYPAISELYHVVKDMARGDKRQALEKKDRMQQNMKRMQAESRLNESILEEMTSLRHNVCFINDNV